MNETALCWLIPLTVGLLSGLLGFMWGRSASNTGSGEKTIERGRYDELREENFHLKQDLELAQTRTRDLEERLAALQKQGSRNRRRRTPGPTPEESRAKPVAPPFDAEFALKEYGKRVKENDLKILEGIGPKIEELFNQYGIRTWRELSETTVERLKEILQEGGERFRLHDPSSWPSQAGMAYYQKWKELATWQEASKAGKYSSPPS